MTKYINYQIYSYGLKNKNKIPFTVPCKSLNLLCNSNVINQSLDHQPFYIYKDLKPITHSTDNQIWYEKWSIARSLFFPLLRWRWFFKPQCLQLHLLFVMKLWVRLSVLHQKMYYFFYIDKYWYWCILIYRFEFINIFEFF